MRQLLLVIIALSLYWANPSQAGEVAGEVRFAVGITRIVEAGGVSHPAAEGMKLQVGDIIETGDGGHIHLRMIDDALISLRPDSALKIIGYTYRVGDPTQTRIRFDLLQGTVRSVTGKGGELAKDKFRMNTPVAAIGVRGTDFIAQSDHQGTRVNVQFGAVVFAPLGEGCQTASLGPCQTAVARVLSADMRNMMLEYRSGMSEPQLLPLSEKMQQLIPAQSATPGSGEARQGNQSPQDPLPGSVQAQTVLNGIAVPQPPNPHYQMVWGRWAGGIPGNDLGQPFLTALQGRDTTVGNWVSGLFRDSGNVVMPPGGQAQFSLRMGEVSLQQGGVARAGQIQGGVLGVDFAKLTFNTRLILSHPALQQAATLTAAGGLRDDGIFLSYPAWSNGRVAGALSRDTREAGYLFDLPTASGPLTGTTLWIRP